MANNASNVTTGRPAVAGGIWVAPKGSTCPTDAETSLDEAFKALGYVSEDGVTDTIERETEDVNAWGGDVVGNNQTSYKDTFKFTLLETLNIDVLKTVFGDSNVTGTLSTGITIKSNSSTLTNKAFVIETITSDNALKRLVIPVGAAVLTGDITYQDKESTSYEIELTALPDSEGNTHYEYIKAGA